MKSVEVRKDLVDALRLDLVGPEPGSPLEGEALPQAPSRRYITGFLVPYEAKEDQKTDPTANEQIDLLSAATGTDDEEAPEQASARKAFFPSSIGLSVLVPAEAKRLRVRITWGDYALAGPDATGAASNQWKRTPRSADVDVPLVKSRTRQPIEVEGSGGLKVIASERPVPGRMSRPGQSLVPKGTRSVSVFVVNHREAADDDKKDQAFIFQAAMVLTSEVPLVPRPNLRGLETEDPDERIADLQYSDVCEFAVGHGVATRSTLEDGVCRKVSTCWIPSAEVERVEPGKVDGVELSMETLGSLDSAEEIRRKVGPLVTLYGAWIEAQRSRAPSKGPRAEVAQDLLQRAAYARKRIEDGLSALDTPEVLDAFRIANRAMAAAARQRAVHGKDKAAKDVAPPSWRLFQLAFILMNIPSLATRTHPEREVVDLLFFPTGGGKTEAYLGLAACTLVLRRLRNPGVASAGVSVLMRYTLRLLTLDQLSRAATLICALELEREQDKRLGEWPFEIGLWVGKAATPNRMGSRVDNDPDTARRKTIAHKNNSRKSAPIPLENCPWCGERFTPNSFILIGGPDNPTDLRISCMNRRCEFRGARYLPVLGVDEPIYRRLPCFLIATVDKFAGLPWFGRVGTLFGNVDRYDGAGFYGPCDPGVGRKLEKALLPPDLIIQDELHLISGPLGTLVGLYETAIDALCTRDDGGKRVRPKIVASTATVRRADAQVRGLFARASVEVFPPPGPNRADSFFAITVPSTEKNARLYVGIAAQGRSLKVVLLRTYLVLLGAAQRAYLAEGGNRNKDNSADPYMTLLGYFNSLRELGGSRRIVEDEVTYRLASYSKHRRAGEAQGLFADREIKYEVVELTSRESTAKVSNAKRRLALPFPDKEAVDVALATNMISVGLDITRLGLMVVLGQPKMTAEYIQATSRVGREESKPGLIATLLNVHRPRDRSHYERFEFYHSSFYRAVEATSVTPFSPRAIDRGIAAVVVGLARHGLLPMTAPKCAVEVTPNRARLGFVAETISQRGEAVTREGEPLRQKLTARVSDLLDEWSKTADKNRAVGAGLQYNRNEASGAARLLVDPMDPELPTMPVAQRKFKAHRSLRDVEPSVNLWLEKLNGGAVEEAED